MNALIFLEELQNHICTIGEAAKILKIRRTSVHALIRRGVLYSIKLGNIHILHRGSVLSYTNHPRRISLKK